MSQFSYKSLGCIAVRNNLLPCSIRKTQPWRHEHSTFTKKNGMNIYSNNHRTLHIFFHIWDIWCGNCNWSYEYIHICCDIEKLKPLNIKLEFNIEWNRALTIACFIFKGNPSTFFVVNYVSFNFIMCVLNYMQCKIIFLNYCFLSCENY